MSHKKSTDDFESYIRNLQLAIQSTAACAQLQGDNPAPRPRRALLLNPYETTIAQMGICRFRT
jgi:hypothetical protein